MGILDRFFGRSRERTPSGAPIYEHKGDGSRPVGYLEEHEEWSQEREAFYEKHFGPIESVHHEIISQIPHIDIYACKPDLAKGRDYYTFVTGGMSDVPMAVPRGVPVEQRRAELVMYCSVADVEKWKSQGLAFPAEFLRLLATFPSCYSTWFGPMHTMPVGDAFDSIMSEPGLNTVFFLSPDHEPPYVRNGLRLGRNVASLLWVVAISEAECDFKLREGGDALLEILKENNHPIVFDTHRRSYL